MFLQVLVMVEQIIGLLPGLRSCRGMGNGVKQHQALFLILPVTGKELGFYSRILQFISNFPFFVIKNEKFSMICRNK